MSIHRPLWFIATALLVISCLSTQLRADDQAASKESAPKGSKVPAQGNPPDLDAIRAISGQPYADSIKAFAASRNLKATEVGTGPVRFLLVGPVALPKADALIALGMQTLATQELWSGQEGIFLSKHPSDSEILRICVFHDGGTFDGYVAAKVPGQDGEFALKSRTLSFPRMNCVVEDRFVHLQENLTVYACSHLSMNAYYNSKGKMPPAWISEGASSQLQRIFCQKQVLCSTFAYEYPSADTTAEYAQNVANMLRKNDPTLIPALSVLRKSLDAIPGSHYRQLWSLFTFFEEYFDKKPGLKNKFYRILDMTLNGIDSETAVKTVFKLTDPALTKKWYDWALSYR